MAMLPCTRLSRSGVISALSSASFEVLLEIAATTLRPLRNGDSKPASTASRPSSLTAICIEPGKSSRVRAPITKSIAVSIQLESLNCGEPSPLPLAAAARLSGMRSAHCVNSGWFCRLPITSRSLSAHCETSAERPTFTRSTG